MLFCSRLNHCDYTTIVLKIKELFPLEPEGIYYVASTKKNDSPRGKCVLAKGKLIDKAKNLIHRGGYARPTKKRKPDLRATNEENQNEPKKQKLEGNDIFTKINNYFSLAKILYLSRSPNK